MVAISTLKEGLSIVAAAAQLLDSGTAKKVVGAAGSAFDVAQRVNDTGSSIFKVTQQTNILSRVFIEESILNEPVLPNLMKSLHEFYAAQIVAALGLSRLVTDKVTVGQVMSLVQTGQNARHKGVVENIFSRASGQESFLSSYLGEAGLEALGPYTHAGATEEGDRLSSEKADTKKRPDLKSVNVRSISTSDNRIGPMGELYEVTLTGPSSVDNKGKKIEGESIRVPVFIQMAPTIVPDDVSPRFIDLGVQPSFFHRWTGMTTGELHWFKDFIMQRDLVQRQRSVLKDPRQAAAYSDFLKTISKKDQYALGDVSSKSTASNSSNLANSVVIFTEESVAQAKADSGIDLHNAKDRQRYFRDVYAMILVIVDTMHQRITIYFNGIDGELDCSYNDFRPKDSKFDPNMFVEAIQALSTNQIGRLR